MASPCSRSTAATPRRRTTSSRPPFLLRGDFRVFAVDTIGHPGKSDEACLPPSGYAYGEWASQVIDGLDFPRMRCIGGSFGAGILAKLMCAAPGKVERAVLFVPLRHQERAGVGTR